MKPFDCVLLLSGGIDSTTTLAMLADNERRPMCLIFNYGQTLLTEIHIAVANADRYRFPYNVVDLDMGWMAPDCALLGDGLAIPMHRNVAQIAAEGTPPTYVPFRNGIFLSIAAAFGEGHQVEDIFCGGNGLNSGNYPDDTIQFAQAMERAINVGTAPWFNCQLHFPNAQVSKAKVVETGLALGVAYQYTWSCYFGGTTHCGTCDSCVQRIAALSANGLSIHGVPL